MNATIKRILIIDDDPDVTGLLKLNLELNGLYEVRTENDSEAALRAAGEFSPDLILLDVMMPGLDGGQLATLFAARARFKQVPIVFLTAAVTRKELSERGGRVGGLPFLAKPADLEEVLRCLSRELAEPAQEKIPA
jgi:two-component system, OmpR family, response regulator